MKNSDMPIHGETVRAGDAMRKTGGLTKREYFAGLAMQGLLAGGYCIDDPAHRLEDVSHEAAGLADALLNQLQATEEEG